MPRLKCKTCRTCFTVFWYNSERYYHCWLCRTTWTGLDSNLIQVEDPREVHGLSIPEVEQPVGKEADNEL